MKGVSFLTEADAFANRQASTALLASDALLSPLLLTLVSPRLISWILLGELALLSRLRQVLKGVP